MFGPRESVDVGGLTDYRASVSDCSRRGAGYVDKILKGAKPADMPVEKPTKLALVINMKTEGARPHHTAVGVAAR